jgi:predicted transcriptional regulator
MSDTRHAMTLRLPKPIADDLALVAGLDETSATAICEAAVEHYLSRRIAATDFQAKLQASIDRAKQHLQAVTDETEV